MSNPFKVGDRLTVTTRTLASRDTSAGTIYTAIHVGEGHGQRGGDSPEDVQFIDDVGDKVVIHYPNLTKE